MTYTLQEWPRAAYELAKSKGFHNRECPRCTQSATADICEVCAGTGQVEVDHKSPTRIASRLALIHCEISEAVECVARGRMDLTLSYPGREPFYVENGRELGWITEEGAKPEGFPIELADVFLRTCDLAYTLGVKIKDFESCEHEGAPFTPEELAAELVGLHEAAVDAGRAWLRLSELVARTFWIARDCGIDLLAMAQLKHKYNKTRPYMHEGKLL